MGLIKVVVGECLLEPINASGSNMLLNQSFWLIGFLQLVTARPVLYMVTRPVHPCLSGRGGVWGMGWMTLVQ